MICLGAIIGDFIGSRFEFKNNKSKEFDLIHIDCRFTDDTMMTCAVMDWISNAETFSPKENAKFIQKWFNNYSYVGYGTMFKKWNTSLVFTKGTSKGVGAAMRASPLGWMLNSPRDVVKASMMISEVSHSDFEAITGAEVVAMCVYLARIGKSKDDIKTFVSKYYDINFDYKDLVDHYEYSEFAKDIVPQAIYCFLLSDSFEEAIRIAVSIGGNSSTLCSIVGGIAEAYFGVPENISDLVFNLLPDDCKKTIQKLNKLLVNDANLVS